MSGTSNTSPQRPKLAEQLVEVAKKAFDPTSGASCRQAGLEEYDALLQRTESWRLLPALNLLIKPNVLPPWLREPLMQALTMLPLRPDGVRATMEFVFSVHPSNSARAVDTASPQKQGASITHEAVAVATKLLSTVPASMAAQEWFNGISGQLFYLMDGEEGPDLARTAAQIVGFGILGRKEYGAPGSPGWNAFVQPLFRDINPSLDNPPPSTTPKPTGNDIEIVDLSNNRVLVTTESLHQSMKRLKVLIVSNPSAGLCRRVMRPILCQICSLAAWPSMPKDKENEIKGIAINLLGTWLKLFGDKEDTVSLLFSDVDGVNSEAVAHTQWEYSSARGRIEILVPSRASSTTSDLDWSNIERRIQTVTDILVSDCTADTVSSMFLYLLHRWIKEMEGQRGIEIRTEVHKGNTESAIHKLIEMTLLQKLLDGAPEKLVSHFKQLMDLICGVLSSKGYSQLSEDILSVILSLLNLVITAPTFKKSDLSPDALRIVETSLECLSNDHRPQISQTAQNLGLLLKYRGEMDDSENSVSITNSLQMEDRRTYNLAINYITGADNPPPVISEGLNMLSKLILSNSSMLDVTAVIVLLSNLLKENEDYLTLRVVKSFTQLAHRHPRTVVRELLDNYIDPQEKSSTDTRLRFGEALLQVVERLGETFGGEIAQDVGESLLSIAGRRGYRPKMRAKHEREQRLKDMKEKKKAKREEKGLPDDEDDESDDIYHDEELTEQERKNNEVLEQIVQGWDSKRGAEDVRIRASSLSIFGTALETNIAGMGSIIVSAGIDLCVSVLTLETGMETGILRRAAIIAILGFVKALASAKEAKRALGFGLTDQSREDISRTLRYVADTDSDGLVQEHARDVVESLENWHMASLVTPQSEAAPTFPSALSGLQLQQPGITSLAGEQRQSRPKIEEIE